MLIYQYFNSKIQQQMPPNFDFLSIFRRKSTNKNKYFSEQEKENGENFKKKGLF
jgi:hypothetical protein